MKRRVEKNNKKYRFYPLTLSVLVSVLGCSGVVFAANENTESGRWQPSFELGGYYSPDSDNRVEAAFLSPLSQSNDSLTFVDVRLRHVDGRVGGYNLALGHRKMLENSWNIGFWGGADSLRSDSGNSFYRAAAGVEALHSDWDLRANGYIPITDAEVSAVGNHQVEVSGDQIRIVGGEEVPLYGGDIEVGYRIPTERLFGESSGETKQDLRIYAGAFYYDHNDAQEETAGPKARLAWQFNDLFERPNARLTFEAKYSKDDVRGDDFEAGIRIHAPLSFGRFSSASRNSSLDRQQRRMVEVLQRDARMVLGQSKSELVVDALTGALFSQVTILDASSNVQVELDAAGQNSLFIAQGDNGNINANAVLHANQTLMGGGSTISVKGADTGAISTFTAAGMRPTMNHAANSAAVTMNNNTHLVGMNLVGAAAGGGNIGVLANGVNNIFVVDNSVDSFGGAGISLTNSDTGTLTVARNTVVNAGTDGLHLGGANTGNLEVNIINNQIDAAALDGIQITALNSINMNLTISNNVVDGAGADAMRFDLQNDSNTAFVISSNRFSGTASDGIEFDVENNSIAVGSVYDNVIENTTFGEGIEIDQDQNSNMTMSIYNNTITNSFADPLDIDLDDTAIGSYHIYGNSFNSSQAASIIDIDTNDNADLKLQMSNNTSNVNLDFDEDGMSTFELEDTLSTNTLTGAATLVIDPLIEIVPAGTHFSQP